MQVFELSNGRYCAVYKDKFVDTKSDISMNCGCEIHCFVKQIEDSS